MITRVEALHFRCLRYVDRPLGPVQILVGKNASGKTTFLDVISFLGTLVSEGLEASFKERTQNPDDLLWGREPGFFELAIEASIPEGRIARNGDKETVPYRTIRYEVAISVDRVSHEPAIHRERGLLATGERPAPTQNPLFPTEFPAPPTLISRKTPAHTRLVFHKTGGSNDNYYSEAARGRGKGGWIPSYRLGPRKSTLGNLPDDESRFPASTWLKDLLREGVQRIVLNSLLLRQASGPVQIRGFKPDGSNLPWVVDDFRRTNRVGFRDWLAHVRTALPDLEDVRTVVRADDKHAYLVLRYRGGLETPSWVVSDGTLRLIALTLLGYLPQFAEVCLIEEPENGIHPIAVDTVYQSLAAAHGRQVLIASHSPVLLSVARLEQILCFAKTPDGATAIVRGDHHPKLQDWRGEISLGAYFASGILG